MYLCVAKNTGGAFQSQFELGFARNNRQNTNTLASNSLTSNGGVKSSSKLYFLS